MIALVERDKTDTVISESQTVKIIYTEDEDEYIHELIGYDDEDNMKNKVKKKEDVYKRKGNCDFNVINNIMTIIKSN